VVEDVEVVVADVGAAAGTLDSCIARNAVLAAVLLVLLARNF
jgi:hypothetical protein